MSLAIFDLDNTLIGGDSDHLWGEFMVEHEFVDPIHYREQNDRFYRDYCNSELDIQAYLNFALAPLAQFSTDQLTKMHNAFMQEKILPIMLPKSKSLIDKHREANDTLLIITATNRFVTSPIAQALGIENILASEPEVVNCRYTGRATGTPCYQHGKVTRLNTWLDEHEQSLEGSWFYSDSVNDIPLLDAVDNPVAVDPDDRLREYALAKGFPVISLR